MLSIINDWWRGYIWALSVIIVGIKDDKEAKRICGFRF